MKISAMRTSYIIGFILSIALTLLAFWLVMAHVFPTAIIIADIVGLAAIQVGVQLFFFLHLGRDSKPYWNVITLLFAAGVIVIIVGGSLWIMNNLNYNMMMSPEQMLHYMSENQGL